jgi:hypothetical protein
MPLPPINHFDMAEFHAWFNNQPCKACGEQTLEFVGPGAHNHYAALICQNEECGAHNGWMAAPRDIAEQKKHRTYRPPAPLTDDYCVLCNRDQLLIASLGLTLVWAHKRNRDALIEAGLPPDGPDEWLRVCSDCHTDVDRRRAQYGRMVSLLHASGSVAADATGIERPMLDQKAG